MLEPINVLHALNKALAELKGIAKKVLSCSQSLWNNYNKIYRKEKVDLELVINIYHKIKQVNDGIRPTN